MVLRKLAACIGGASFRPAIPAGDRVYAIGDVHGRLDLLHQLLQRIEADNAARGRADTWLILLGDLINRGPESRAVIDRVMRLTQSARATICLMGNHEDLLLRVWNGQEAAVPPFLNAGGDATLKSYGCDLPADALDRLTDAMIIGLVRAWIPKAHIDFLTKFASHCAMGDYVFVHAGIRPGVALQAQDPIDMRWIRTPFLKSRRDHGACIVHGHSISAGPDIQPNRIGIDTGAYRTGTLTAIGLQGQDRWFLAT